MHKNLLNAGFAYVDYSNYKNENVYAIRIIKRLTKELSAWAKAFSAYMPVTDCFFRVKELVEKRD